MAGCHPHLERVGSLKAWESRLAWMGKVRERIASGAEKWEGGDQGLAWMGKKWERIASEAEEWGG